MRIISPTYKRANKTTTHLLLPQCVYAVHEFEVEEYRAKGFQDLLALPDEKRGNIASVRNYIVEHEIKRGEKELLLVDDDLLSVQEFYDAGPKPKKLENEKLTKRIQQCFALAQQWGVSLWGINCVSEKGGFKEYTPFSLKRYCSASFHGLILDRLQKIRYDVNLPLKEDYDLCLQLLHRDRKILRINSLSMTKHDHKNEGGCALYRNTRREQQQLKALALKWGDKIVATDSLSKEKLDINPVIRPPIGGV